MQEYISVFGPRRTGTNYIENLFLLNSGHFVTDLNRESSKIIRDNTRRPNRFEEIGSKHDANAINTAIKDRHKVYVVYRNPLDWLNARLRYQEEFMGDIWHIDRDLIKKVLEKEYINFYKTALRNYDKAVFLSYDYTLSNITYFYSKAYSDIDCEDGLVKQPQNEILPGGSIGKKYSKRSPSTEIVKLFNEDLSYIKNDAAILEVNRLCEV
jgi:hypothetical protein